ncbi:hypothetical protein [Vannielia litorea]|uniref:hypothetical protein n=1 Tax=Vannielia litorea TaxID=1217970 RepID=UPI001C98280F|nr:hypothetical protein [Vannielia litorea]MBY6050026.1 hypothetical protein [Vannielia litorea]MBY6077440.1 hypothetical protein [Vannielia litorea]
MNTKPSFPTDLLPSEEAQSRLVPVAVACGLVAGGALLWRAKPRALEIPDPVPLGAKPSKSLFRRMARRSRDGVHKIAPGNISVSLGRSLVIAGGALLLTRLLDELAGED